MHLCGGRNALRVKNIMKLSIAWLFDHVSQNWKELNIHDLMSQFGATTAEVDSVEHIKIDLDLFTVVKVIEINENGIKAHSFELRKDILLPERKDVVIGNIYLIKKEQKSYRWALLTDLGSQKDGLFTNIWCSEKDLKGGWKDNFEYEDYIITIDNKALTNRPDMWGHRGVAREIAALINKNLTPEENFLASKPIKHYANISPVTSTNPLTVEISKNNQSCNNACRRLAGLYMGSVENKASNIWMATRLARVDSRPLNFLVDTTNYVMYDIGQPMHAFDADTIKSKTLIVRCAIEGEKLKLLDGTDIALTPLDLIISDSDRPLALAGVMGGIESSITKNTKTLFIESGNFDASTIRKTAARFKKRTESSTRFEKSLDPNQNTQAILRFLKLSNDFGLNYQAADSVVSIGPLAHEVIIKVSHDLIVNKLGINVNADTVENILMKIGFGVQSVYDKSEIIYSVTVPTYRCTKDITIPEDIVEEVSRFIGYDKIPQVPPMRAMQPFNIRWINKLRSIKYHMAYSLKMHEVQTYAFFDEEFLKKIEFEPTDTLNIANPLSEHWQRLITSLVPNLLKCVSTNNAKQEVLNFFEYNRVWFYEDKKPVESLELAGIFYKHKEQIDFYEYKAKINSIFNMLTLDVKWVKPQKNNIDPWYNANQFAEIVYQDRVIGQAGKISLQMLNIIDPLGDAFIFELDGNFLINFIPEIHKFESLPKYPEVDLDISLLVPQDITAYQLEDVIKSADKRIKYVHLIDFFHKSEWGNNKSMTYRFVVYDEQKTMTKEEIDVVWESVVNNMKKIGATIR